MSANPPGRSARDGNKPSKNNAPKAILTEVDLTICHGHGHSQKMGRGCPRALNPACIVQGQLPMCPRHNFRHIPHGHCEARGPNRKRCNRAVYAVGPSIQLCKDHKDVQMPCYFNRLPTELRLAVYEMLIPEGNFDPESVDYRDYSSLSQVNKEVSAEVSGTLHLSPNRALAICISSRDVYSMGNSDINDLRRRRRPGTRYSIPENALTKLEVAARFAYIEITVDMTGVDLKFDDGGFVSLLRNIQYVASGLAHHLNKPSTLKRDSGETKSGRTTISISFLHEARPEKQEDHSALEKHIHRVIVAASAARSLFARHSVRMNVQKWSLRIHIDFSRSCPWSSPRPEWSYPWDLVTKTILVEDSKITVENVMVYDYSGPLRPEPKITAHAAAFQNLFSTSALQLHVSTTYELSRQVLKTILQVCQDLITQAYDWCVPFEVPATRLTMRYGQSRQRCLLIYSLDAIELMASYAYISEDMRALEQALEHVKALRDDHAKGVKTLGERSLLKGQCSLQILSDFPDDHPSRFDGLSETVVADGVVHRRLMVPSVLDEESNAVKEWINARSKSMADVEVVYRRAWHEDSQS